MLYVGIEYEIRFVTSNFDNLKLIMDSFDKLDFFNRSVRIENDFYFECLTKTIWEDLNLKRKYAHWEI